MAYGVRRWHHVLFKAISVALTSTHCIWSLFTIKTLLERAGLRTAAPAWDHFSLADGCLELSGSEPVVEPQVRNVLEVRGVVGHQRQVVDKSDRSNHQVHPTHRYSLLEQRSPDLAELVGSTARQNRERQLRSW